MSRSTSRSRSRRDEINEEVQLEALPLPNAAEGIESNGFLGRANRPVTLKFEDVVYEIELNKTSLLSRSCCSGGNQTAAPQIEKKTILKGVSGAALPGEMVAVLGPSGSGKTTLLTAIAGRLGGKLSGTITYNGKQFSNVTKRNMGFVTQDDVLLPGLTVTETLVFTALLRIPNSLTRKEKECHAKAVIEKLGLTQCKDSIIGGQYVRGISGGERKRVSIGQEILVNPGLLFLDEPTSGLDSTTAQRILSMLLEMAEGGRTVVMTIHQPSSRIFYMFHKVLLLADGNPLYFGRGSDALGYFQSVGHAPSLLMNPADFLLDLASGISSNGSEGNRVAVKDGLVSAYEHKLKNKLKEELKGISYQGQEISIDDKKKIGRWSTTWWQQFTVLLRRGVRENRHETFSPFTICQIIFASFLAGLLWWKSNVGHLQDQLGLLFFYVNFWALYPIIQSVFTFPKERAVLTKERSSSMYRLSAYFMARMTGDMPLELILPMSFVIITYWMAGLRPTAANFFITLSVLLLCVVASQGLGLAISALVMDVKMAGTLASIIVLLFTLSGGYIVQNVPVFISWVKYISVVQYTYKLLLISQYSRGQMYPCGPGNSLCPVSEFPSIKLVGLNQVAISVVALFIMAIGYRIIAYLALMRLGVVK